MKQCSGREVTTPTRFDRQEEPPKAHRVVLVVHLQGPRGGATHSTREIQRGEQWDFFFAPRFDAVELRPSPRLLATAQNTNFQVRLHGFWAMEDALCAESW
jgi:hypothetical protein